MGIESWNCRRQRRYGGHRIDRTDFGDYPCFVRSDILAKNQALSMRRGIIIIALLAAATPVLACEYCLGTGSANEQTIKALVFSMASLLSVIGFVGVGIGMFFYKTHCRANALKSVKTSGSVYRDPVNGSSESDVV